MIDLAEIQAVATDLGLSPEVVEKDYVLGWLLAGIYAQPALSTSWVFKGGTCLKKCYFETIVSPKISTSRSRTRHTSMPSFYGLRLLTYRLGSTSVPVYGSRPNNFASMSMRIPAAARAAKEGCTTRDHDLDLERFRVSNSISQ
jgi:Nucleotidyl transferase AbiEii toxin, Type IV TA system